MDELRDRLFYDQKNGYDLIGTDERIKAEAEVDAVFSDIRNDIDRQLAGLVRG